MSLFYDIVQRRPKKDNKLDIRPLWKIKLTDSEFEELQSFLLTGINQKYPAWFKQYPKECLLFFAEYWKRYFDGGPHSIKDVCDCLYPGLDEDYQKAFYAAAKNGAQQLKVEIFRENKTQTLDSILYQGGLPMRLICEPDSERYQNWHKFVRQLIRGYIDLSDEKLGLGRIATNLSAIRQYAQQLYLGVASERPEEMPFYCPNAEHPWFKTLMLIKKGEAEPKQESNPFAISWLLELDDYNHRCRILGRIKIPSRLSPSFIQEHTSSDNRYTTARVMTDGTVRASVEYQQGSARMSREILLPMPTIDSVISIDFENNIVSTANFDYTQPQLFSVIGMQSNGMIRGEKANRIKEMPMMVFIPVNWTLESTENLEIIEYKFFDSPIKIVQLPEDFSKEIRLKDPIGNTIVFSGNPISATQLIYRPLYSDLVLSPSLCNASDIAKCHVVTEKSEGTLRQPMPIEFESQDKREWTSEPAFGRIRARAKGTDKEISEPVTLYNVGSPFHIEIVKADSDSASIRFSWANGKATCVEENAVYCPEKSVWTIRKENLMDSKVIRFRLKATGIDSSSFLLKLRAPFRQVEITDESGLPINGTSYVPFCDYEKFSYSIFGYDSAFIKVDSDSYRIGKFDKKLYRYAGNDFTRCPKKKLYGHGSIAALFGSSGEIRKRLDNDGTSIADANVEARLSIPNEVSITLNIREYPFRLKWESNENKFILTDPEGKERPFRHSLLAFRLNHPNVPPISIHPDDSGSLRMPDELLKENDILVAGNVSGRVLPALFNKSSSLSPLDILSCIDNQIKGEKIGSEIWEDCLNWFNQASNYGIPYSSLLQLRAICLHQETLMVFLFQCFLKYGSEQEKLLWRLLQFSQDLNFKWFWLIPVLRKGIVKVLDNKIDFNNESFIRMLVPDAIATLPMQYLDPIAIRLIPDKMNEFDAFLSELIKRSLRDTKDYISKEMYEVACGWLRNIGKYSGVKFESNPELLPDFTSYLNTPTNDFDRFYDNNKTRSENWILSRVAAFKDHLQGGTTDLFSMSQQAKRSLCLCYEIKPNHFIREVHNLMIQA